MTTTIGYCDIHGDYDAGHNYTCPDCQAQPSPACGGPRPLKPMCAANCGNRTEVWGHKYCPDCDSKYAAARETLVFCPASEAPSYDPDCGTHYLLLNPCDGYHLAYANFDVDDKDFLGFSNWTRDDYLEKDFFIAWAKIPDPLKHLIPIFQEKNYEQRT